MTTTRQRLEEIQRLAALAIAEIDAAADSPSPGIPDPPLPEPTPEPPPPSSPAPSAKSIALLWKNGGNPKPTNDGNIACLIALPESKWADVNFHHSKGKERLAFAGNTNPKRPTYRGMYPGSWYGKGGLYARHVASGSVWVWTIPDAGKRHEAIIPKLASGQPDTPNPPTPPPPTPNPDPQPPTDGNITRDRRAVLWFSGSTPNDAYGFENAIAICRNGRNSQAGENWLQINPIDGDRPNPTADAARAKRGGYSAVCLDMESGSGGNGFDLNLHKSYWNVCKSQGVRFIGGPKSGWEHFLRGGARYEAILAHMQATTDAQVWWNYGIDRTRWASQLVQARRGGYTKPIYCLAADGNGRAPPFTQYPEGVEIMKMCGQGNEGWGIFFPHKRPDLSRRYAAAAKGLYA